MSEMVNHPSHYQAEGRKECIEEIKALAGRHETAVFCKWNAYKYRYRAGMKEGNPAEQDLKKAEWYENYYKSLGYSLKPDWYEKLIAELKDLEEFGWI